MELFNELGALTDVYVELDSLPTEGTPPPMIIKSLTSSIGRYTKALIHLP